MLHWDIERAPIFITKIYFGKIDGILIYFFKGGLDFHCMHCHGLM